MKVTFVKTLANPYGVMQAGETFDLPEKEANGHVKAGNAKFAEKQSNVITKEVSADVLPVKHNRRRANNVGASESTLADNT